jgi:hypothetical protein
MTCSLEGSILNLKALCKVISPPLDLIRTDVLI